MENNSVDLNEMPVSKSNGTNILAILVLVMLVIGSVYYFMRVSNKSAEKTVTESQNSQVQVQPVVQEKTQPSENQKEVKFTVSGANFSFNPTSMKVKQGDKVTIEFKNTEGTHDFVLDEFNVKTNVLNEGQSETISFIADKKGEFEYYCSVGKHRAMGMVGTLVVE